MWICAELLVTRSLTVVEILEGRWVEQKCTVALLDYCRAMHLASACQAAICKIIVWLQEEVAREEAHKASQEARLKEQEARVKEKEKEIEAKQASLIRQMQEVDSKGRELDNLNKKYEKAVAAMPVGEDAGEPDQALDELHHVASKIIGIPGEDCYSRTPFASAHKI